jgi:hypothetical protein
LKFSGFDAAIVVEIEGRNEPICPVLSSGGRAESLDCTRNQNRGRRQLKRVVPR